jgi:5-methylcytosine-specific restriction endonuclease McrA
MSNFDLEEYRTFVRSKMIDKASYHKVDITEKLLEALFQFEVAPSVYLKDIRHDTISDKYRIIFDLSDKKSNLYMNDWFLYKFGYKHCSKCKEIKLLENFGIDITRGSNLYKYCKICKNKDSVVWRKDNPEKVKEYRLTNLDTIKKTQKEYYIVNSDKIKETVKNYRTANPDKINALKAKHRASKVQATPKWLTKEQRKEILAFYSKAKQLEQETGIKYHIDHIVPLQGKNVCGLHVPWNLQVIPSAENLRKGNRYNDI